MAAEQQHQDFADDLASLCVLLVEDDEIMRLSLEDRLRLEGIPVRVAADLAGAKQQLDRGDIDLVVTDIRLPDGSGASFFEDISRDHPGMPVVLMTAFGEVADAVALVKAGAVDYLTKPFDLDGFIGTVKRNLSRIADTSLKSGPLRIHGEEFRPGAGVIGKSPAMRRIERLVARLANVDSSVLITGESGVGKEVVASLIHTNSRRAAGPLVTVNCAAVPHNLVESEFFGHEKGAFTGATGRRIGRFEQAQGGTIFLDEIAETPLDVQVKLLRVLQERDLERVGGSETIPLDVRVIAATQVDLDEAVKAGDFRADLYWRLNVIHIEIPPLRDRPDDILYLSRLFVAQHIAEMQVPVAGLSAEAETALLAMNFPGNVRELKNILERAVALCDGPRIMPRDLSPMESFDEAVEDERSPSLREAVAEAELQAIRQALVANDWAILKAAQSLGISRKNLWEKMKRYGITQPEG